MAGLHTSAGRDAFLSSPIAGWDHIPSSAHGNNTSTPAAAEFKAIKHITLMDRQLIVIEDSSSGAAAGSGMTPYVMSRAWVRNDIDLEPPTTNASSREPFLTTAALPPPPSGTDPALPSVLNASVVGSVVDVPKDSRPNGLFEQHKKHWVAVRAHHSALDKARMSRHAVSPKLQV